MGERLRSRGVESGHEKSVPLEELKGGNLLYFNYKLKIGDRGVLTRLPLDIIAGQNDRITGAVERAGGLQNIQWEIKRAVASGELLIVVLMPTNQTEEELLPGLPHIPMNGLTISVRLDKGRQNSSVAPFDGSGMEIFSKI